MSIRYDSGQGIMFATTRFEPDPTRTDTGADFIGSILIDFDENGDFTAERRYEPYGELLAGTATTFGWTGNTGSRATLLQYAEQYNRRRHYSTKLKQWTTRDPLWPSESAYGYVNAGPLTAIDPTGELSWNLIDLNPRQVDLAEAQRMINAAYAAGGLAAARALLAKLISLFPHLAAALIGWYTGRYLDEKYKISDKILDCIYTTQLGPYDKDEIKKETIKVSWIEFNKKRDKGTRNLCLVSCHHSVNILDSHPVQPYVCAWATGPNCPLACKAAEARARNYALAGHKTRHCKNYCPVTGVHPSPATLERCRPKFK